MQATDPTRLSVEEMCNVLAQHLLKVTDGTGCDFDAQIVCSDQEGIDYARLLELLHLAEIPPSRFFAEVVALWRDTAAQRRRTSSVG